MFYKPNATITINSTTYLVCIKKKTDAQQISGDGLLIERIRYVGNAVNPNILPPTIIPGSRGNITIDAESSNIQGDFIFEDVQRTRFKFLERVVGQTFSGVLIPAKINNPSLWE